MPSTLSQFRKHQKILMVMTTGLAMISFVILGAASSANPSEMPAVLVVLALAALLGGAAWVIGQVNGKSSEYLTVGAVAGAVLGLWLSWGKQDPTAIHIDSGDLSGREVFNMKRDRNIANRFVGEAYQRVNGFNAQFAEQFGQRVFFHYTPGAFDSDFEMAITALLQREAEKLGIGISPKGVFDFIRGLAMTSGKSLTSEQFAEIRQRLGVSEEHLIEALSNELLARRAYDLLYSQRPMPTPEALYDYYRKLNLQQEAEIAVLPVKDFIDPKAEPTTRELEELFEKYKSNPPGYTQEGKFVEGQPGFRQPARMKVAYLEAVYDNFEKQVGEITDKEIEARYEELKTRPIGDPFSLPGDPGDLPMITPGGSTNPLEGIPPMSIKAPEVPALDGAAPPASAPPEATKPEATKPETSAPAAPAAPKADTPMPEAKPPEAAAPEKTPEKQPETTAPPEDSSSMLPDLSKLQLVVYQDEQPPPPPVATTDQAAPAAPSTPALPPPAPPTIPGAEAPPAEPPLPTVRPLDDTYRKELREEILRERTQALMEKKIEEATQWVASEVSALINTPPDDKNHLTPEAASKKLKEYAEKNGFVYIETPFVSFQELQSSEDYPIGSAAAVNHPQKADVATDLFESFGRQLTYMPRPAAELDPDNQGSRFVYWIAGEKPQKSDDDPESLDDPIVKAQVVKAWREMKARTRAEERAAELVKMAKAADKPLQEVLGEQTVTGKPVGGDAGSGYISVHPTGKFSWYRMSVVPSRSLQRESAPTLTELPGLKPLGNEFFTTVFDKLKVGEVGTAASADKSEIYVVKIVNRTPSTPEELKTFRDTFLARGLANEYFDLASRDWALHGKNPINELLTKNNVRFNRPEDGPLEE